MSWHNKQSSPVICLGVPSTVIRMAGIVIYAHAEVMESSSPA
jgi:hypothetical protein